LVRTKFPTAAVDRNPGPGEKTHRAAEHDEPGAALADRPPGDTVLAEQLMEDDAEDIVRAAISSAKAGDPRNFV
jgi:hypothetical protein